MKKTILKLAFAATVLGGSVSAANAAVYDFVDMIDNPVASTIWKDVSGNNLQGEQGAAKYNFVSSGLTLTTTAYEITSNGNVNSFVYMDGKSGGPGGMGVCSAINTNSLQCIDSSDDNVSNDAADGQEVLQWSFDKKVSSIDFTLGDAKHNSFADNTLQYRIDGGTWTVATASGGALTLDFGLNAIKTIDFRTDDHGGDKAFYIQKADVLTLATVSAVPEASTYALMLSGLGFVGFMVKRRKKA